MLLKDKSCKTCGNFCQGYAWECDSKGVPIGGSGHVICFNCVSFTEYDGYTCTNWKAKLEYDR